MRCFQCVDNFCPQGLNPMLINEIIKWYYRKNNLADYSYPDPKSHNAPQRVIASIQVSSDDLKRISTPPNTTEEARYVLFPGCNVYFQPDKVLSVLDVMDYITEDYVFLPGLDYCCGNAYLSSGQIERGGKVSKELIDKLSSYNPDTVIFWCSTCLCNIHKTISQLEGLEVPFNMMSFAQFLAQNMQKLPFKELVHKNKKVTLHEPCKAAFTGLDLTGPRDVLKQIPGIELIEMPRHGKNTACCGSAAQNYFPHSFERMRGERLDEAANTSADLLVDICHYCHEIFADQEQKYDYSIVNYMTLITEPLGIEREDKFKKYKQWADIDEILKDAEEFVESSPYSVSQIREALKKRLSLK